MRQQAAKSIKNGCQVPGKTSARSNYHIPKTVETFNVHVHYHVASNFRVQGTDLSFSGLGPHILALNPNPTLGPTPQK